MTERPFICALGGLVSDDGVNFTHFSPEPVLTPAMCGSPLGSVQDPRVVALDVERVRVVEDRGVAPRGGEPEEELRALG